MPKKIVIIHFQPIELYPPVQNLINFLEDKTSEHAISVVTTKPVSNIFSFQEKKLKYFDLAKQVCKTVLEDP